MKNCVQYKSEWLHKSSEAFKLFQEQDFKKLDKHIKEVNQKFKDQTK